MRYPENICEEEKMKDVIFEKLTCGCGSDRFKISVCGLKMMCHRCGEIWEIEKLKANNKREKEMGMKVEMVMKIKQKSSPGDSGKYPCTCGKDLNYALADNGHIRIKCDHCGFVAME